MSPPRAVALLGGSFDPVHLGHVALARSALEQLPVDELWWVPVGQAWQKSRALTAAEHRVAMLQRTIGREPRQRVETCEIERGGPTYTIDTLETLGRRHPGVVWYLVLGWDQFCNLPTWHRWPDIAARVRLAVAPRAASGPKGQQGPQGHQDHQGPSVEPPHAEPTEPPALKGQTVQRLHMAPWSVSSTAIRAAAAQGHNLLAQVPAPVARYIAEHHLYRPD